MFSKSCEYAIKAAIFIANNSLVDKKVGFVDIAKMIDSPEAFTAKILQKLTKDGVIQSVRGVNGGFYIPKNFFCYFVNVICMVNDIFGANYSGLVKGIHRDGGIRYVN